MTDIYSHLGCKIWPIGGWRIVQKLRFLDWKMKNQVFLTKIEFHPNWASLYEKLTQDSCYYYLDIDRVQIFSNFHIGWHYFADLLIKAFTTNCWTWLWTTLFLVKVASNSEFLGVFYIFLRGKYLSPCGPWWGGNSFQKLSIRARVFDDAKKFIFTGIS